jgi:hypothetical protein
MKLLAVILSVSAVSAYGSGGQSEWSTYKHWAEMKAQESCWGEDNMKQYMVNMKQAVAKCNQVDAPELSLPPYKSTYRFINTLLTNAEETENNKINYIYNMMQKMNNQHENRYNNYNNYDNNRNSYHSNKYESSNSNAWMEKMMKKVMMQKMFQKNDMDMDFDSHSSNKYSSDKYSSDFDEDSMMQSMMEYKMKNMMSRNKREAGKDTATTLPVSLDIGDRLADKVKAQQERKQEQIGNMTCVLRECGILNEKNELDARAQKQYMNQFKVEAWLKDRIEDDIDTCVELAEGIPSDYMESYNFPGYANVAQIKTYMKCIKYAKMRSCMYKDVKDKLEANFGPLEKILEQTQLTEDQLYPLVMNLMHGDEMEYGF